MSEASGPDEIARALDRWIRDGRMPGAAWWVANRCGVVSRGALGVAVAEPLGEPLTVTTPFDLASLTKPLCTALILVLLEQEGVVDPRRPVAEILGELKGSPVGAASLLDLATHTSRLAAWRPLYLDAHDSAGYLERLAAEVPAVPRGRPLYSDLGYLVLGLAIERLTGTTLCRLFRQRIAGPLGLPRMGFARDRSQYADAAATERGNAYERRLAGSAGDGHPWRTDVLRGEVHDGNAHGLGGVAGHAGLFGRVEEVAAIASEILQPRALALRSPARRRLLEPEVAWPGRTVGLVLADASGAARGILPGAAPGHTGFTGTSLWLDPDRGDVLVLLTNRVHPTVGPADFKIVRRGFHRIARRAASG